MSVSVRRLSLVVRAVGLAGAVVVAASSGGAEAAVAARPVVVYDAIGETRVDLDMTSAAVARDELGGLTFAVNVASRPAMKRGDVISIGIDSDRRLATGSNGVDVVLQLAWPTGAKEPSYSIATWEGSGWRFADVAARVSYTLHGLRFGVAGSDIGVGASFRFAAKAERTAAPARADRIPATGLASAVLVSPAAIGEMDRLVIPFAGLMPEAGKILRVSGIEMTVAQDEIEVAPGIGVGAMVRPEKVRCSAKIGQVELPPVGVCAWHVPGSARGKTLMLKVSVAFRGDEWTGVYPLDVR